MMTATNIALTLLVLVNDQLYDTTEGYLTVGNIELPVTDPLTVDGKVFKAVAPFVFKNKLQLVRTYGLLRKAGLEVFYCHCEVLGEDKLRYKINPCNTKVQQDSLNKFLDKIQYNASAHGLNIGRNAVLIPLLMKWQGASASEILLTGVTCVSYSLKAELMIAGLAAVYNAKKWPDFKKNTVRAIVFTTAYYVASECISRVVKPNQRNNNLLYSHNVLKPEHQPANWWQHVSKLPPETLFEKAQRKLKKFI
jgi:hypothetical protein